jgi:hypothetical protein
MRLSLVCCLAVLALAACGDDADPEVPGGADPAEVTVIDEWATALREGDVDAAARFFAIPSVAQNGSAPFRIRDLADAKLFNASLPCGAELTEATQEDDYVIATFTLTERPGPGACGQGTGETAQTAFVIEEGEIVEWRRVVPTDEQVPGSSV